MLNLFTVSSARPYKQSSSQQMQSTPVNAKIMKKCKHRQKIRFIQCLSLLWILASCSSVAIAQNDSRTIEDGGTGDYKAIMISDKTLPTHTIFRPKDLSVFGRDEKLPVIAWGNGRSEERRVGKEGRWRRGKEQ